MSENASQSESESNDEQLAEQLGQIAEEIADCIERGQPVDLQQYIQRNPELSDVLPGVYMSVRGLSNWDQDAFSSDTTSAADNQVANGIQLGDFRLAREIGRGGMGIVYEAEQLSLRRRVALKIFPFASVLEPNKLQRFKNEALASASLEHPHIVPVHSVGVDRSTHFYAMRLIEGSSLSRVIHEFHASRGGFPNSSIGGSDDRDSRASAHADESVISTTRLATQSTVDSRSTSERNRYQKQMAGWIRDAANALHYAHDMGIVHRDVKPSNLLIDAQQKVWITDFGLATTSFGANLTLTGDVLGTLPYMSPEQASGERTNCRPSDRRLLTGGDAFRITDGMQTVPVRQASRVDSANSV